MLIFHLIVFVAIRVFVFWLLFLFLFVGFVESMNVEGFGGRYDTVKSREMEKD